MQIMDIILENNYDFYIYSFFSNNRLNLWLALRVKILCT